MTSEKLELTQTLEERFKKDKVRSVALQVAVKNEVVYDYFYGAYDEKGSQPTEDTLYGVASLTKSVTAVGIMMLQDEGKLLVTDLVSSWIPELKLPKSYSEKITIHHLLTHTAGFPGMTALNLARLESLERDPDTAYLFGEFPQSEQSVITVNDMVKVMNNLDYKLIAEPGTLFNYSNESYALLEEIIERASNDNYINYINEKIFSPLEMNHSIFTVEALKDYPEVASPYAFTKDEQQDVFHSPTWWETGEIYGAGALKSTTKDMLKYLEIFKHDGSVNGQVILSRSAVKAMTTAHIQTPNENKYGYGLMVGEFAGRKVIGHGGGVKGVSSYMLVCQELNFSAVALTNIAEIAAEDYVVTAFNQITKTVVSLVYNKTQPKEDLNQYVGNYVSTEGNKIEVKQLSENKLELKIGHLTLEAVYEKEQIFSLPNGKKLAFVVQDNEVTGIFRGMRYIEKVN